MTGEECVATVCERVATVWTFTPSVDGLVPSCQPHALDITVGATKIVDDPPVRERGRCSA